MPNSALLQPKCLNKDRLRLWTPASSSLSSLPIALQTKKQTVLLNSINESTRNTYGTGLASFHLFCDSYNIPWTNRAPASAELISAFVAHLASHYSASTITNYVSGVRMWHIIHSIPWTPNPTELHSLLRGAKLLQPKPKPPRAPLFVSDINKIMSHLKLSQPLHAAVFACLTTTFFACARLGEFTVLNFKAFNPALHVTRANVKIIKDIHDDPTTTFFLPHTKTQPFGETVFWKRQSIPCDPEKALANHLFINKPRPNSHLFAYRVKSKLRPLSRTVFLVTLKRAAKKANVSFNFGHSLRIGGTLEYMLRGVPFDIIKQQGRWRSDAFTTYLRQHAKTISPYLAQDYTLQTMFLHATQPLVK